MFTVHCTVHCTLYIVQFYMKCHERARDRKAGSQENILIAIKGHETPRDRYTCAL